MKKFTFVITLLLAIAVFADDNKPCLTKNSLRTQLKTAESVNNSDQGLVGLAQKSNCAINTSCNTKCTKPAMGCGYNAPAGCEMFGCFDFYTKASFIYWQPFEEGLSLAIINSDNTTKIVDMDYDYKPGFKVGVGLGSDYDSWDVYLGYTWYHLTQSRIILLPQDGTVSYLLWFDAQNIPQNSQYLGVKGNWKLDLDIVDLELARLYFVGKKLIFRPFIGLRSSWISQEMKNLANFVTWGEKEVKILSESWAIGARSGLNTNWLIGCGFRTFGNCAASLLYTDYHKVVKDEDDIDTLVLGSKYLHAVNKFKYLRTNLEFNLGFGWGSFFSNKNNYFDISLGYDFNVFFNQNMMRFYSDELISRTSHGAQNLYAHGLNVSLQLAF